MDEIIIFGMVAWFICMVVNHADEITKDIVSKTRQPFKGLLRLISLTPLLVLWFAGLGMFNVWLWIIEND